MAAELNFVSGTAATEIQQQICPHSYISLYFMQICVG